MMMTRAVSGKAASARLSLARPALARPAALRRRGVVAKAAETEGADEVTAKVQAYLADTTKFVTTKWEETSDGEKPAAVALVIGAVVAQIAIGATVDAVDKLPILSDLFELLGFVVIGVFGWKLATEPSERESLKSSFDAFISSVTGK